MRQRAMLTVAVGLLVLSTGCPEVYGKGGKLDQAMEMDLKAMQEERRRELKEQAQELDDDEEGHCPEGKVEVRDCTSWPCKVECK